MKSLADEHAYDPLRAGDAEDDDDADSDLDVTMDLNESDYLRPAAGPRRPHPQQQGRGRRWWWRRRQQQRASVPAAAYRWGLDALLLLVIVGLVAERQWGRAPPAPAPERPRHDGGGDVTGFAPQFAQQIRTFHPEPIFMPDNTSEFFSPEVRQKWLDIVPPGLGYLHIADPQKYHDLPRPLVGYDGHVATTSMTHQLHCLYAIGEVYAALTSNRTEFLMEPWHMNHCFDYLRQSIMCCGDVALEGEQTTFPPGFDGSDGWDAKHVCKDYSQVYAYLETNAVDNRTWI